MRGLVCAVVLLLAGCAPSSGAPDAAAPSDPGSSAAPTDGAAAEETPGDTTPTDPGEDASPGADAGSAVPCDDAEQDAVAAVVDDQLAAMAAGDWAEALAHASRGFRATVDADQLRSIIVDGFPVVAEHTTHTVTGCVRSGDAVQLLVEVGAADGRSSDLVYLLVHEDGGWAVDGAVPHGGGGTGPVTTV